MISLPSSARFGLLLFAFSAAALLACAGSAEPKPENHACFRALECQAGLVCVEGRCTADLAPIVPEASAAAPGAAPSPPGRSDAGTSATEYE